MWFDRWSDLLRVTVIGAASYATLIVLLRLSGKRTLAKLNAFDLIVTVALGSVLATSAVSRDVSYVECLTALALLIVAQLVVTALSVRSSLVRRSVRSSPALLVVEGRLLDDQLDQQRVTRSEVMQAIRGAGQGGLDAIAAVVLETDGTLSVVPDDARGDAMALEEISLWREAAGEADRLTPARGSSDGPRGTPRRTSLPTSWFP